MYLWALTLIFVILSVVTIGVSLLKSKKVGKIATIFNMLAFIFAVATPLYFMFGLSGEIQQGIASTMGSSGIETDMGFWFNQGEAGNVFSFGPGLSWYFMIIGAVIALVFAIILLQKPKLKIEGKPE